MNSFSEEWLRLREPADAAARNPEIASGLAAHLADRTKVTFVDLGCGAGANLGHTALLLPRDMRQCWRLLDHDPRLLLSARGRLAAWADKFSEAPSGALQLEKGGREIEVSFCEADLNGNIERFLHPDEIVTASAFFDLVSRDWIVRFARSRRGVGVRRLRPAHLQWHSNLVAASSGRLANACGFQCSSAPRQEIRNSRRTWSRRRASRSVVRKGIYRYSGRQFLATWAARCELDRHACRNLGRRRRRTGAL